MHEQQKTTGRVENPNSKQITLGGIQIQSSTIIRQIYL